MKRSLFLAATVWVLALPAQGWSQTASSSAPAGWRMQQSGNEVVVMPPDLEDGEFFAIGILWDLDVPGHAVRDWFQRKVDSSASKLGRQVKDEGIKPYARGGLATTRIYTTKAGTTMVAGFGMRPQSNGKFLLVSLICSSDACRAHHAAGQEWVKKFATEKGGDIETVGGGNLAASSPSEGQDPPGRRQQEAAPPPAQARPAYQTEPGRGIKPGEVERVTYLFDMSPMSGASMSPILLLKSGDYCENLNLPPGDIDVAQHKKAFPGAWGKWRRRGDKFQTLDDNGRWHDTKWEGLLPPARAGDKLKGTFKRIVGGGTIGGATSVVSSSTITFRPDGRFVHGNFGGVWTSGGGPGPATSHASSSRQREGTYHLDGRTIEFRFNDGTVDRKAFHWVDDKNKDAILLNASFYFIDK